MNLFYFLYKEVRKAIRSFLYKRSLRFFTNKELIVLLGELECKCASCGKKEV